MLLQSINNLEDISLKTISLLCHHTLQSAPETLACLGHSVPVQVCHGGGDSILQVAGVGVKSPIGFPLHNAPQEKITGVEIWRGGGHCSFFQPLFPQFQGHQNCRSVMFSSAEDMFLGQITQKVVQTTDKSLNLTFPK